ncbi:hypothetical protein DL764_008239 [Monosporascus ibericus]|uniref:Uncharacterized protein n=1 Tax=Monosporascus ibericus TaxID=155417 RepID=A0A4Q4T106_9PEZI|nr:hypothetical protein DL764_008239 [Monosporascus ibericus]
MSKVVGDVKSGLKAARGAGDAIRGSAMEVTDQAFDRDPNHPETVASRTRNHALVEKGKQDMHLSDEEIALRERQREAKHSTTGTANTPAAASAPNAGGMARPNDPQLR